MKIERSGRNSCFVSDNNLTVFVDRWTDGSFRLKVNRARTTAPNIKVWDDVGFMMLDLKEFDRLLSLLCSMIDSEALLVNK